MPENGNIQPHGERSFKNNGDDLERQELPRTRDEFLAFMEDSRWQDSESAQEVFNEAMAAALGNRTIRFIGTESPHLRFAYIEGQHYPLLGIQPGSKNVLVEPFRRHPDESIRGFVLTVKERGLRYQYHIFGEDLLELLGDYDCVFVEDQSVENL